jgi:hypothetical protein
VTTAARAANAASFAAIVVFAWVLLRRHTTSQFVVMGATLFVAVSPALLRVADNAWSEPMFCALVLLFIVVLEGALAAKERRKRLIVLAGLVAGLAFLVRYAAVALPIAGVMVVLGSSKDEAHSRVSDVARFVMAAALIPAFWVLRNASSGGQFVLGPRVRAPDGLFVFVSRFVSSLSSLFVRSGSPLIRAVVVGALVAVALLGPAALIHDRVIGESGAGRWTVVPLVTCVVVYAVFIVLAGKTAGTSVNGRIVSPIYVPVLILGAWLFEEALRVARRLARPMWCRPAPWALMLVALGYLAVTSVSFVQVSWADGQAPRGYASSASRRSPLAETAESLNPGALMATNRPWALYSATHRQPIVPSPGKPAPELSLTPETIAELAGQSCTRDVYLVWFRSTATWSFKLSKLAATLRLDTIRNTADGVLYAVHPKSGTCRMARKPHMRATGAPRSGHREAPARRKHECHWPVRGCVDPRNESCAANEST